MIQPQAKPFTLPALPYEQNALEPYVSAKTLNYHYGKHHQGYVNHLNELVSETEFADLKLEDIISAIAREAGKTAIFNHAAQVWNHTFYWSSLSPKGGGKPSGKLGKKIELSFGSYKNFIEEFAQAGVDQFGSGWVWLVKEGGVLKITRTSNAGNPISEGLGTPLLALDVWEHAYYLDYQNRRNDYLTTILDKLINWNFAAENFCRK